MVCIIIDDDATARLIIKQHCLNSNKIRILEEFSSAIDAIKYLNNNSVDLVYLDIHMPTFSGFDFIETLKNPPKIVLTTSDKNLALEAFEYKSVVDYLVKPISKERFEKSKGDYINIKTDTKNFLVHSTLKKIEDKLPSNMFFKVHRSFIINFSEIIDIEDNSVLIRQVVVPVSRSKKSELMNKLNLL